jgi:hypothetical protein
MEQVAHVAIRKEKALRHQEVAQPVKKVWSQPRAMPSAPPRIYR